MRKFKKNLSGEAKKTVVKYLTMVADHVDGGLKMLHIRAKFKLLKLAWVRRLKDENHHPWKIISKYFFNPNEIFFPNTKPEIHIKLPYQIHPIIDERLRYINSE